MFATKPDPNETKAERQPRGKNAARTVLAATLLAANGLLPASQPVQHLPAGEVQNQLPAGKTPDRLTAHSEIDAVPPEVVGDGSDSAPSVSIPVEEAVVGPAAVQVRRADGSEGPIIDRTQQLPPAEVGQ